MSERLVSSPDGPAKVNPYSKEWVRKLARTLALVSLLGAFVGDRRRTQDFIVAYIQLLSYVCKRMQFLSCLSLWPLTVGFLVYLAFRHPRKLLVGYAALFLVTYRKNARFTGSQISRWFDGEFLGASVLRFLQASLHTPYLAPLHSLASQGHRFVFAVHPHSVFAISTLAQFCLNRFAMRARLGPNIDFRILTIGINSFIPILRELLMARGFVCADKRTFSSLLSQGISPVIVTGGAEEALHAYPGSADLVMKKRTGFVREAIENNAWLVPIYCFGDNESVPVWRTESALRIQRFVQKLITFATPFALPIFTGPPVKMVIGAPLPPPTSGTVQERTTQYHAMYMEAVKALYNAFVGELGTEAEKRGKGIRFIK